MNAVWLDLSVQAADQQHTTKIAAALSLQMLHAFLPAVDVELSVYFGGATEPGSD
jgi:hypothetical protein